ncbi:methyltransferase [Ascobolus immersus RN42]|uniref:tRNA N(3)-methylcytidine methyltransferase n=1 Tax=Ascobolus immersus RN42 TaxID=1160509 RepID=A0A3N4HYI9_ASCIM|nr:methyltransferase [Ascobolus immersus RN42]
MTVAQTTQETPSPIEVTEATLPSLDKLSISDETTTAPTEPESNPTNPENPTTEDPIKIKKPALQERLARGDVPFTFGQRFLDDTQDVFSHNAWDHVEPDEEFLNFTEVQLNLQRENPVDEEAKLKYNENPAKFWDKFYKFNTKNFFKDRKWLGIEFPSLFECVKEGAGDKRILEVGAGAGNTFFPLLRENHNDKLRLVAADYSKKAIQVIREQEEFKTAHESGVADAVVWDLSAVGEDGGCSRPEGVEPNSLDAVIMVFVFSALAPDQWEQAVKNVSGLLKKGGKVLFRDYGRGDLAQVRMKKGRYLQENFYIRGDGTRVYFFDEEELRTEMEKGGLKVDHFAFDRRMIVNRQRRLKMFRCWAQMVCTKE